MLLRLPQKAKAQDVDANPRRTRVAIRGSAIRCIVAPAATATHPEPASRWSTRIASGGRTIIVTVVPILHPLPYISCYIIYTKWVGRKRTHRGCIFPTVFSFG
ncbi:hypothetical protein THIOM_002160 [Candidatus Thiomargarita nelsonii]|uniref:Uncharacterized protein n=1 Tax=Candidatus Thiomargarita nelsonii TaxID=1003181 RepID=A0A176S283_9GAMM|nr:hypothetical protein THIOM_002160 [Candidatus Thiomargarita nelsonii]